MKWQQVVYKIGEVFGIAATLFIALWLLFHPDHEPRLWLRAFEIIGSLIAAAILAIDVLDLTPEWD